MKNKFILENLKFENLKNIVYEKPDRLILKRGFDAEITVPLDIAKECGIEKSFVLNCSVKGSSVSFNISEPELLNNKKINKDNYKELLNFLYKEAKELDLNLYITKNLIQKNSYPLSLNNKLSSRNKIWFKNENKTVKDMLDYIAGHDMNDFTLEFNDSTDSFYIQAYDNGWKKRGRMTISEEEIKYLYEQLKNEHVKDSINYSFSKNTGKLLSDKFPEYFVSKIKDRINEINDLLNGVPELKEPDVINLIKLCQKSLKDDNDKKLFDAFLKQKNFKDENEMKKYFSSMLRENKTASRESEIER